jgi:predicted RNase H-like HicB family nuclease
MQAIEIDYVVWKEDKYFVSRCINVEVSSFGETIEEAISNLKEAVELYLEDKDARGLLKGRKFQDAIFTTISVKMKK